jgi:hypothetical protein
LRRYNKVDNKGATTDLVVELCDEMKNLKVEVAGRGFHSSTSLLNLSRFYHWNTGTT